MHRTFGDGYVEEPAPGQYHRFIDQALPTVPGTVDTAEYNNAVQEEICNVIEMNGETLNGGGLNGTPAADRTAGWHQLYDVIFQNEHLTDNAIDEITFAKITGSISQVDGGKEWNQDIDGLQYINGTAQCALAYSGLVLNDTGDSTIATNLALGSLTVTVDDIQSVLYGKGVRFSNGPGDVTSFKAARLRKSAHVILEIA